MIPVLFVFQRNTSTLQGHQHPQDTVRQPKDKDPKSNKTGIIYHYKCPHINCLEEYIRESGRALGDRVKEHLKAPSPIHQHSTTTGHPLDPELFIIIHKEVNSHSRTIKESMFICIHDPTLNRNLGKYQLLHIWDHLLQASAALQLKPFSLPASPLPLTTPLPIIPLHPHCLCKGGTNLSFLGKYLMQGFQTPPQTTLIPPCPSKTLPPTRVPSG